MPQRRIQPFLFLFLYLFVIILFLLFTVLFNLRNAIDDDERKEKEGRDGRLLISVDRYRSAAVESGDEMGEIIGISVSNYN